MGRASRSEIAAALTWLTGGEGRRLAAEGDVFRAGSTRIGADAVRGMVADGLLRETPRGLSASEAAASWLARRASADTPFRRQHGTLTEAVHLDDAGRGALYDHDESPVGTLARRSGKDGAPWLGAHAVAAAERLRRDFELGGLQPRITSSWSAAISSGRRGERGGVADLTEMAMAARRRFDAAVARVGPELAGVLVDVCCFLKGLETVEREHQWPARSAKLVLRIALDALARHYGLTVSASGRPHSAGVRHWGAEDYRPDIT